MQDGAELPILLSQAVYFLVQSNRGGELAYKRLTPVGIDELATGRESFLAQQVNLTYRSGEIAQSERSHLTTPQVRVDHYARPSIQRFRGLIFEQERQDTLSGFPLDSPAHDGGIFQRTERTRPFALPIVA
jgi:hypothetical protein